MSKKSDSLRAEMDFRAIWCKTCEGIRCLPCECGACRINAEAKAIRKGTTTLEKVA